MCREVVRSCEHFAEYDVAIVGGGHAGIEAAAAASASAATVLITASKDNVGKLSCNPAIGGLAKSQIVCETACVGGLIGKTADKCAVHADVLNSSRGRAVQAVRLQVDSLLFRSASAAALKQIKIVIDKVNTIRYALGRFQVELQRSKCVLAKTLVFAAGTFSRAVCHIGECALSCGRLKEKNPNCLMSVLRKHNVKLLQLS